MTERVVAVSRYSAGAILLHWLIAAALLFEIGLGWGMEDAGPQRFAVYQLHKSVGITILILTLLRIGWRLGHRPPALSPDLRPWERVLARITHLGFYALLIGLPLSGWLLVSTSRIAVPTILYGVLPLPHLPVAALGSGARAALHDTAEIGHLAFGYALYLLFALHVAGALKHHFIDRGDDLRRMLPLAGGRMTVGLSLVALLTVGFAFAGRRLPLAAPPPPPPGEPLAVQSFAPVAAPQPDALPVAEPADTTLNAATSAVPEEVQPAHWRVLADKSSLSFRTTWGEAAVEGGFRRWQADITFDPAALDQSSVKVEIDMASVTSSSPETQSALPGDDWFAVSRYPSAIFAADRFRKLGGDRYEAIGELRLRGVSRPLRLPFTLNVSGDRAKMTGTASIDRIRYGVGQGQWTSTSEVPADVTVHVELEARRSGSR